MFVFVFGLDWVYLGYVFDLSLLFIGLFDILLACVWFDLVLIYLVLTFCLLCLLGV